jgi:hypothetical protein
LLAGAHPGGWTLKPRQLPIVNQACDKQPPLFNGQLP